MLDTELHGRLKLRHTGVRIALGQLTKLVSAAKVNVPDCSAAGVKSYLAYLDARF